MSKKFTEYSQLNLSEINKEVLKKWDENDVFSKSMTEREGYPSFVFYEGPPSANGMPGIHHVMARTIKDTFCRFKTMKGFPSAYSFRAGSGFSRPKKAGSAACVFPDGKNGENVVK